MSISENIKDIEEKIERAAIKSGRQRKDILLLAVSKTVECDRIKQAMECGLTSLGENKPQEIVRKYDELPGAKWHQIGHLQTNKVKYIIDKVELIHSVDSLKLGEEIEKRAAKLGLRADVLVEVNIAGEESKHGVKPEETRALIEEISKFDHVRVRGLMTVAPFVPDPEENRKYFGQMYKMFKDIGQCGYDNVSMDFLSMGMTNDYEVAIEEGANIVRIGTGIFGARNYDIK
ncbi:MAG: YggS family pyridoxal phosphate-dependent enzyme [Firmicutes bacterium]|nr:YggS family pyridoxal phosphate-dependent enzyme [Bacillota bacterium]